jgi:hypothetical protein
LKKYPEQKQNIAEISTKYGNYLKTPHNKVEIYTLLMTKIPKTKSGFKTIRKSHKFVDFLGVQKNCLWIFFAFFQVWLLLILLMTIGMYLQLTILTISLLTIVQLFNC